MTNKKKPAASHAVQASELWGEKHKFFDKARTAELGFQFKDEVEMMSAVEFRLAEIRQWVDMERLPIRDASIATDMLKKVAALSLGLGIASMMASRSAQKPRQKDALREAFIAALRKHKDRSFNDALDALCESPHAGLRITQQGRSYRVEDENAKAKGKNAVRVWGVKAIEGMRTEAAKPRPRTPR